MNVAERNELIDELLDGSIGESDFVRLEAELSVNVAARQEYYRRNTLSMLLENVARQTDSRQQRVHRPMLLPSAGWVMTLAATVGFLLATAWWHASQRGLSDDVTASSPAGIQEEEHAGFGVLVKQVNARWGHGVSLSEGALLPLERLQLDSGAVQIELFSGVGLVIEGRAEFQVLSPMEVVVDRGKLRATVPEPAHGFSVQTSRGKIVDLGTEFALDISSGRSEVHVLDGEIEWFPQGDAVAGERIAGGKGIRYAASGERATLAAEPGRFLSEQQLRAQSATARTSERKVWREYIARLRNDQRLVAFYQIENGAKWDRRLPNLAIHGTSRASEGAIVAADRVAGRWGDDGAINFNPTGSRVRLSVSGELHSLTLSCWVKINSLDRWYNSLFLTDGHERHEPHWQIMDDGRLFFSVKKRDTWDPRKGEKDKHVYYSPPFWDSTLSGRWLMLATVYDTQARHVTHYLNGEQLSREAIPQEYLVETIRIGNASLGNWGLPERDDPNFAVRNFNGSMDEFALFDAALSPDEIKEHYEHGKP